MLTNLPLVIGTSSIALVYRAGFVSWLPPPTNQTEGAFAIVGCARI
jgi:hypothetical protein